MWKEKTAVHEGIRHKRRKKYKNESFTAGNKKIKIKKCIYFISNKKFTRFSVNGRAFRLHHSFE
jgi:hypothetical protein